MKVCNTKQVKFLGKWITFGYSMRRIGFGFSLDRYSMQIDFFFLWLGFEF